MKRNIWTAIVYSALIVMAASMTTIVYWLYSVPKDIVTVSPNPIPVVTKVVKEDGTCAALGFSRCAILNFTRCKNVDAKGRVVITLVGVDSQLTLPTTTDNSERRCDNDIRLPFPIPPQAAPGKYHLHFRATYQVNPIRSVIAEFDTEEFTVQ